MKKILVAPLQVLWVTCLTALYSGSVWADPNVSSSTLFTAADGTRTYLDVGGVWDGSADISGSGGDTVALVINNAAAPAESADALNIDIILPIGVTYFNDSAAITLSGAGCGAVPAINDGVTANQTGGTVSLSLAAGAYNLPADCELSLNYEVMAESTAATGGNAIQHDYAYTAISGSVDPANTNLSVDINSGSSVLSFDNLNPTAAVNQNVAWTVSALNTGSGGLFDVVISLDDIDQFGSLALVDLVQSAPVAPAAVGFIASSGSTSCTLGAAAPAPVCDSLRLPYLSPAQTFSADLNATVAACERIENEVGLSDRINSSPVTLTSQVTLDLQEPLINFTAPTGTFPFAGSQAYSVTVNGVAAGDARALSIATNLNALGLTVDSVASTDWVESGGTFTYIGTGTLANPDDFSGSGSSTINFTASGADVCNAPNGGLVTWSPSYENVCGNSFALPTRFNNITGPDGFPTIDLAKTITGSASAERLDLGQAANYSLVLSATNVSNIASDPIVITDTLPTNIDAVTTPTPPAGINSTVSCPGGTCDPGETITWTINPTLAPAWDGTARTLDIPFVATTVACEGGNDVINTANLPDLVTTGAACVLPGQSPSVLVRMGNSPNVNTNIEFNAIAPATGSNYETGTMNADCAATDGEGECITMAASYEFTAGYAGSWTSSSFTDDFGANANVNYVPDTLEISMNGGTSFTPVLDASGCIATNASPATDRINIDMGCVMTDLGENSTIAGDDIEIRYKLVGNDDALAGAQTNDVNSQSVLTVSGAASQAGTCDIGGGNAQFTLPTTFTLARAAAEIEVQSFPATVDICEVVPVSLNVTNNDNDTQETSRDIIVQLLSNGDYDFVSTVTPTYGGIFTGNIDETLGATNGPTFEYDVSSDNSYDEEIGLAQNGTVNVSIQRKAQSGAGFGQSGVSARVDYDDNQSLIPLGISKGFSDTDTATPTLVQEGALTITSSPQSVTVSGTTATWVAYVTNGGNGAAYNVQFDNTLPAGLNANLTATNIANTNICNITARPVTAAEPSAGLMRFSVGDIAAGETCPITIVATVASAASCSIADNSNLMEASWGCGGLNHQAPNGALSPADDPLKDNSPNFLFLSGSLEVNHLTTPPEDSFCELCDDTGRITLEVRNNGGAHIYNVEVRETLGSSTGLSFVADSLEVSVNGAAYAALGAAGNPTIAANNTLVWDETVISALADLYPLAEASASGTATNPNYIRFRFSVSTDATPFNSDPSIQGAASGDRACGGAAISAPTSNFSLPVRKPELNITKTGRVQGSGAAFSEDVYAQPGDTIEWQVLVNNVGDHDARNVRIQDFLPAVAGSTSTISGGGLASQAITNTDVLAVNDINDGGASTFTVLQNIPVALAACPNLENDFKATFGCEAPPAPGPHSDLPNATGVRGTANLFLAPVFSAENINQSFTALSGGRSEIQIQYTNTGAPAILTSLQDTLPNDGGTALFVLDTSFTPTYQIESAAAVNMTNTGTAAIPEFNLGGITVGANETITFTLRIVQNEKFDTGFAIFTTNENDNDTADPARNDLDSSTNNIVLNFSDGCGLNDTASDSTAFTAATPDVELNVSPGNTIVNAGTALNFTFRLRNEGDSGSIADNLVFTLPAATLGTDWTINSVTIIENASGTVSIACGATSPYTCSAANIGSLQARADASEQVRIQVNATPANSGGTLRMRGEVEGSIFNNAGVDTTNNYTLDQRQARVIGFDLNKTISTTSVNADTASDVVIGETVTYLLRAEWYGLDVSGSDTVQGITLTDTLPANLDFLSVAQTANNTVSFSAFPPTPTGGPGGEVLAFNINTINTASPGDVFEVTVNAQVLNNAATQALNTTTGLVQTNTLDADFDTVADGSTRNFTDQETLDVTVGRPALSLDKQVRMLPGVIGDFANTASGDAADGFQYRLRIQNTGNAPAYDISITDLLQTDDLSITTTASTKGADSTAFPGDGVVDTQGGAISTPSNDQIIFNDTELAGLTLGQSLARLDAGEEIILLYQADIDPSAIPGQSLLNDADLLASTAPGVLGEQDPTQAVDANGEWLITASDSATVAVDNAAIQKTIVTTSENADASADVRIGEQIRYQIQVVLPEGTSPAFNIVDSLPAGLRLIQATDGQAESDVVYDASTNIACVNQSPVITPAAQPVNGALTLNWNFGNCTVATGGSAAERTVAVTYVAQVRNIAANADDTGSLSPSPVDNSAVFQINGVTSTSDVVNLSVQEADITATKTVDSTSGALDAGGTVTYRVRLENTSTEDAYDLHIIDSLPTGMSFAGNTTFDAINSTSVNITGLAAGGTDTQGNTVSWGRLQSAGAQNLDLEAGAVIEFTFDATITAAAQADQTLTNAITVDWTSLNGNGTELSTTPTRGSASDDDGERTGGTVAGSGSNTAIDTDTDNNITIVDNVGLAGKVATNVSNPGQPFRIGDIAEYTITVNVQEGVMNNVVIQDVLPAGFIFTGTGLGTQNINGQTAPYTGTGAFDFDINNENAAAGGTNGQVNVDTTQLAASRTVRWVFADIENTVNAAADTITIVYRTQVDDNATAFPAGTDTFGAPNTTNTVSLFYDDANGTGNANGTTTTESVTVNQPVIDNFVKQRIGGAGVVGADETVQYQISFTNNGDAAAYNLRITDSIPDALAGQAVATPAAPVTVDLVQIGATDITASYDALGEYSYTDNTGANDVFDIALADANDIDVGETVTIRYTLRTRTDLGGGVSLTNTATIPEYYSLPSGSSNAADRRTYTDATLTDSVTISSPAPTNITKLVNTASANVGETLTYTITVPGTTVDTQLWDVIINDTVPSNLEILSITDTSGDCSGFSTTGTSGQSVRVNCDSIAANDQATIQIQARIDNVAANNSTVPATLFENNASFVWSQTDGAPSQTAITTASPASTTVGEPEITITKSAPVLSASPMGIGDTATYTITVTNDAGATGTAYDLLITDTADTNLFLQSNPAGLPVPTGTGGVGSGNGGTYIWQTDEDLLPGQSFQFNAVFEVGAGAAGFDDMSNSANVAAASTEVPNADTRTYTDDASVVNFQVGGITTTKTLVGANTSFAVGDTFQYRIVITSQTGNLSNLVLTDFMPYGLIYLGNTTPPTFSYTNIEAAGGGAITPTFPTTDVEVSGPPSTPINITFGSLQNQGLATEPSIEVVLTVMLGDNMGAQSGSSIVNAASISFDDPTGGGGPIDLNTSGIDIDVDEPAFTLSKTGAAIINQGSTANFTVDAENSGDAAAFEASFQDQLPVGMRQSTPSAIALSVYTDNTAASLDRTLVLNTDYTVSYVSTTGLLDITLLGARPDAVIDSGEMLRINYNAQLDTSYDTSGASLVNRAAATEFFSQDTGATVRRTYTNTFGAGTDTDGDDYQAVHSVQTETPSFVFTKAVQNQTTAQNPGSNAEPGHVLRYTLTVTNTGQQAASVDLTDDIDAAHASPLFQAGTLSIITPPASGANASNASGGTFGTGLVSYTGINLAAAGGSASVVFDVTLNNPIPSGSQINNQARIATAGFSDIPSDDANNPGGSGTENPTPTQIGSRPVMSLLKTSADITGDANDLQVGDTLRYTIVARNDGDEIAVSTNVSDNIPANTTYVPGSTVLNGVTVPDVGGTTALAQSGGIAIQSNDVATSLPASGIMNTQPVSGTARVATITFDTVVNAGVVNGTIISNQAILTGSGQGSGPFSPVPSDDPSTSSAGDPTQNIVGNGPFLDATKVAAYSTPLSINGLVTYTITINNLGNEAANNVIFTDLLNSAELIYETASLQIDTGAGFTLLSDTVAGDDQGDVGQTTADTVTVNLASLAAGTSVQVRFQARVQANGVINNQGNVTADDLPNEPTDVDGDDSNGDQVTPVFVGTSPQLQIDKAVSDINGGTVQAGDSLEYSITVNNIGGGNADPVTISDTIDTSVLTFEAGSLYLDSVQLSDASNGDDEGDYNVTTADTVTVVTDASDPLLPGESINVRFRATVSNSINNGDDIDNTATANAPGTSGPVNDAANVDAGGSAGLANLSGNVWLDLDHDDAFDVADEPAQSGWIVEIVLNGNVLGSTTTDSNGAYSFLGLAPGSGYELRFTSPNGNNAPLGQTIPSLGSAGLGRISGITLNAGDNILDQNLPIDPSGIVYDSVQRTPQSGVTLQFFRTDGGTPVLVSDACLGSTTAQGQTTGSDGYYAFFVAPGTDATCPDSPSTTYEIQVTVPVGYVTPPSGIIPAETGAFNAIGACQSDAVLATADCEVQAQNTHPTAAQDTTYFLQFNIDSSSPDIFNNHIPVDPILGDVIAITKTTPLLNVNKGQLVPYTISARNTQTFTITDFEIRDNFPAGFKYVEGSAKVDGTDTEPTINGLQLTWGPYNLAPDQTIDVQILLLVGAGVSESQYVNRAQIYSTLIADTTLSPEATATVRVVPDPVFDCTDIIGQVYDDKNMNGYQDEGEEGLPAVRVSTARGLLSTTDEYGRYHVTCAAVPNADRGSNFIIKLDERTLPSGYRVTTENPRVKRITRGKANKFNFGAAIHRVVRLDLGNSAFAENGVAIRSSREAGLETLIETLRGKPSTLRLSYLARGESEKLIKQRLKNLEAWIQSRWQALDCCYNLTIETEVFTRKEQTLNNNDNKNSEVK